eukprot:jgi/Botrbrau1/1864/Bobra.146_1s0051.1
MSAAKPLFLSVLSITAVWTVAGLAARIEHVLIGVPDIERTANSLRTHYGLPVGDYGMVGGMQAISVPVGNGTTLKLIQHPPTQPQPHNVLEKAVMRAMRPKGSQFVAFTIAADEPASDLAGRLKSSSIGLSWKDSLKQEGQGELTVVGLEALEEAPLPFFTVGKEARADRALLAVEDPPPSSRWVSGRREGRKDRVSARVGVARQAQEGPCSGPECRGSASSDALTSSPSVTPAGIQYLELAGDRNRFNAWVGPNKVPVKWSRRPGPQGIVSVVIRTVEGPFIVLHEGKIY